MSPHNPTAGPKIPVQWMPMSVGEWIVEIISLGILLLSALHLLLSWDALPDQVATHFGFDGRPRGHNPKSVLWLLPGIGFSTYVLMSWLSRVPRLHNYPTQVTERSAARIYSLSRSTFNLMKVEIVTLLGYIEWKILQAPRGADGGLHGWVMMTAVAIMLASSIYPALRIRQIQDER